MPVLWDGTPRNAVALPCMRPWGPERRRAQRTGRQDRFHSVTGMRPSGRVQAARTQSPSCLSRPKLAMCVFRKGIHRTSGCSDTPRKKRKRRLPLRLLQCMKPNRMSGSSRPGCHRGLGPADSAPRSRSTCQLCHRQVMGVCLLPAGLFGHEKGCRSDACNGSRMRKQGF